MSITLLSHFTVHDLHGSRTFSIPIRDNKLILIGVNGLGKSTIISLLYFTLTRQWQRLSEYEFSEIVIAINQSEISIKKDDIVPYLKVRRLFRSSVFRHSRTLTSPAAEAYEFGFDWDMIASLPGLSMPELQAAAEELRIPTSTLIGLKRDLTKSDYLPDTKSNPLQTTTTLLSELITSRVLFLPTYRRIEKDLETIVPELRDEIRRFNERAAQRGTKLGRGFLELVQFGMDVLRHRNGTP